MKVSKEPAWSIKDLATHKNVLAETLHNRSRAMPLPEPVNFGTNSGCTPNVSAIKRKAQRYKRSELLAWFDKVEAHKPVKRLS